MGTDIHLYVEKRTSPSDPWVWADEVKETECGLQAKHIYRDRSYDTFSILADVRNGFGFAGVRTGEGFVPISPPKGFPHDLSEPLKNHLVEWVEHTPSWLTLREIFDYDWTQTTTKSGVVSLDEWNYFRSYGRPNSWAGDVSGPKIFKVTDSCLSTLSERLFTSRKYLNDESLERLRVVACDELLGVSPAGARIHAEISWRVKYYESAAGFWSKAVPQLLRFGEPENVRVVFFFDS